MIYVIYRLIFGTTLLIFRVPLGRRKPKWTSNCEVAGSGVVTTRNLSSVSMSARRTGTTTSTLLISQICLINCRAQEPRPLLYIHCSSERHNAKAKKHTRMWARTRSSLW